MQQSKQIENLQAELKRQQDDKLAIKKEFKDFKLLH